MVHKGSLRSLTGDEMIDVQIVDMVRLLGVFIYKKKKKFILFNTTYIDLQNATPSSKRIIIYILILNQ